MVRRELIQIEHRLYSPKKNSWVKNLLFSSLLEIRYVLNDLPTGGNSAFFKLLEEKKADHFTRQKKAMIQKTDENSKKIYKTCSPIKLIAIFEAITTTKNHSKLLQIAK